MTKAPNGLNAIGSEGSTNGARGSVTSLGRAAGMVLLALVAMLAVGCGASISIDLGDGDDDAKESHENSFEVDQSPVLIVDSFNGPITVTAGTDGVVQVQATLTKPEHIEYEATQSGNTVTIMSRQTGTTFGRSPNTEIVITAPASTTVDLRTSNGRIEVTGTSASAELRTSNGAIRASDLIGELAAETSNGPIEVSAFEGSVDLETSNGSITFAGILSPSGVHEMRTSNGNVDVTLGGTPSLRLDASTSNGKVASKLPVLTTSTGDTHLEGTIGDGDGELTLRSSNGSVTLQ